jgi:hypothetical protein
LQEFPQVLPVSRQIRRYVAILPACLAVSVLLGACGEPQTEARARASLPRCTEDGHLRVETFGAVAARIDWHGDSLTCEGMKRPRGRGARLRFAGELELEGKQRPFAIILSIPDLRRGRAAEELATRVTFIEEDAARFFSTRETDICWSDVNEQSPMRRPDGTAIKDRFLISGVTYCMAPIAELNGNESITLSELEFSGQLRWAKPN